jgi:hypothetical protein
MFALIRRNRRPTVLRRLLSAVQRDAPDDLGRTVSRLPSHHILCAGTYTPVFARLAAEAAIRACPAQLRPDFRLFIHVDGVAGRSRANLMAWLREVPGVEVTYGLFGILAQDRIPGKWHQLMINDLVREFSNEPHLAFVDADLFVSGQAWWNDCLSRLGDDVFALSAGLRENRCMSIDGRSFFPIKTNLFTLNTAAHGELNQQRFSKDARALALLRKEYPRSSLVAPNIDSMIAVSLRAQARGLQVIDIDERIDYCHVGGFSHLSTNKFLGFEAPENRPVIEAWLVRLRLLTRVLNHFLAQGWGIFVDRDYRGKIEQAQAFVAANPFLDGLMRTVATNRHEQVFEQLFPRSS